MNYNKNFKLICQEIFCLINDGYNTVLNLAEKTDLNPTAITDICKTLSEKGLINMTINKTGAKGRPAYQFSISKDHYCAYIEENKDYFSCILIDITGKAIERINKVKSSLVDNSDIIERFLRDIKIFDNNRKLCRNIYIDCTDQTASLLSSEFTRIESKEIVVKALKKDEELSLFLFNDECMLNLYGKITKSSANKEFLLNSFNFDKIYEFNAPFYEEIFDAISKLVFEEMKKLI